MIGQAGFAEGVFGQGPALEEGLVSLPGACAVAELAAGAIELDPLIDLLELDDHGSRGDLLALFHEEALDHAAGPGRDGCALLGAEAGAREVAGCHRADLDGQGADGDGGRLWGRGGGLGSLLAASEEEARE